MTNPDTPKIVELTAADCPPELVNQITKNAPSTEQEENADVET